MLNADYVYIPSSNEFILIWIPPSNNGKGQLKQTVYFLVFCSANQDQY